MTRRPLAVLLPLQALLYFFHLKLLSPWFDEADQLLFLHTTLARSIAIPASGGHPPLYFAVMYYWMRLPLGLDWTVQARVFSVVLALAATVAADRLWAHTLPRRWRWTFLALWALSPFLLLYSRMSRSYSFQLLIGTTASAYLLRFLEKGTRRTGILLAVWLAVGVYVHAIPGFALLGSANLLLLWRRRLRDALAIDAFVGVVYLPWLAHLLAFLPQWGKHGGDLYALTGRTALEIPVKLAYWAFSFTMGEAVPDAVLIASLVVGLGVALLLVTGARRRPDLVGVALPAAIIGFVGVARWNSYPFIPARMIFLFPIFLMLVVSGAMARRRLGPAVVAGMLALSLSGIVSYFRLAGFRNKQYPMPIAAIAAKIRQESATGSAAVLVDSTNSDPIAMRLELGDVLETADKATPDEVRRLLADPRIQTIWFLRNTHDVSPGRLDRAFEDMLRPGMRETVFSYEPFTPLELDVARAAGVKDPPRYFHELLKFERRIRAPVPGN